MCPSAEGVKTTSPRTSQVTAALRDKSQSRTLAVSDSGNLSAGRRLNTHCVETSRHAHPSLSAADCPVLPPPRIYVILPCALGCHLGKSSFFIKVTMWVNLATGRKSGLGCVSSLPPWTILEYFCVCLYYIQKALVRATRGFFFVCDCIEI